jgi:hypothetical protein
VSHAGQWGLRTISGEELLLCNDVGAPTVSILLPDQPNHSFYSVLLPGKCLLAGFYSLFNKGGSGIRDFDGMDNNQNYNDREEEVMEMQVEHDSPPKLSSTFVGAAQGKREHSAKSDDAAVPKYLWLEMEHDSPPKLSSTFVGAA